MDIHEYQAKELLARYGVVIPGNGGVAATAAEARRHDFNIWSPDLGSGAAANAVAKGSFKATCDDSNFVATRGSPRCPRRTPDGNKTTAPGRFPGSRVVAFARLPNNQRDCQWLIGRRLAGYSCGGSRGVTPRSLDHAPGGLLRP